MWRQLMVLPPVFFGLKTDNLFSHRHLQSDDLFSYRLLTTAIFRRRLSSILRKVNGQSSLDFTKCPFR